MLGPETLLVQSNVQQTVWFYDQREVLCTSFGRCCKGDHCREPIGLLGCLFKPKLLSGKLFSGKYPF